MQILEHVQLYIILKGLLKKPSKSYFTLQKFLVLAQLDPNFLYVSIFWHMIILEFSCCKIFKKKTPNKAFIKLNLNFIIYFYGVPKSKYFK